ncbi:undecaprenyl-diphosphate phosphatase [Tumebacillus permanentifrigoris]|uniref:Undecaprenyl-diphosphatase n=1 Tax=Tumebacillus permanentifrigoris TaxID=378543 RepID=A0A316DGR2_9BACL|nr:undecaprenyl-diphosphate phosphatase [Tumebacillus permanentifrigoris]PWK16429.1 undecaprenyl-diphosphatase [Tumebacillus permanentifrigoris]
MDHYVVSVIEGIIEGLTEFLPVSSTGHMILAGDLMNFTGEKAETFEVVIQLGAILAIVILYWSRLIGLFNLDELKKLKNARSQQTRKLNLVHIFLGIVPAMGIGFVIHDFIKEYLFSAGTVVAALVAGGLLMIYAEKRQPRVTADTVDDLSYGQALKIGLFQMLSLWPGFSRSGSTIAGGLLTGASHKAAADFSFLMAVPIMVMASAYSLYKSYKVLSMDDIGYFAVGFFVAFVVAWVAVVSFLKLLNKVKLSPFAYYRFVLAAVFWFFILR